MPGIKNFDIYNTRMKKTLLDKIWWLTHINDSITTIVDYGCADGSLYELVNELFPDKFNYIGIDNSDTMLNLAKEKYKGNSKCSFYSTLDDLNRENLHIGDVSILLLNSVIHEFNSWLTIEANAMIESDIEKFNPKYIAVRDMADFNYSTDEDFNPMNAKLDVDFINKKIAESAYADVFKDWLNSKSARMAQNTVTFFTEFFLKYRYKENWERERDEIYLWPWYYELTYKLNKYWIEYEESFNIQYLVDCIKRDFGIDWSMYNTHIKLLLTRE